MKKGLALLAAGLLAAACQRAPTAADDAAAAKNTCYSFRTVNNIAVVEGGEHMADHLAYTIRPYRLDIRSSHKRCGWFKEIVWTNDIGIHLSERLGECQRRAVLAHEKKHVASYLKAFEDIPPWVDAYMNSDGQRAFIEQLYKDIYARLHTLQEDITEDSRQFDWRQYKNPQVPHYVVKACGSLWGETSAPAPAPRSAPGR